MKKIFLPKVIIIVRLLTVIDTFTGIVQLN